MIAKLLRWTDQKLKLNCPECGGTEHEVVEWVHYGHDRPVRRCECGHTWCNYPGIEIEEAKDE